MQQRSRLTGGTEGGLNENISKARDRGGLTGEWVNVKEKNEGLGATRWEIGSGIKVILKK